jgi:pilus assembly protein CpaF
MTIQRGSDDEEQVISQQGQQFADDEPAHSSKIAEESTVKLGEVLPVRERPAAPPSHRPPEITNAPTKLLSLPSQPELTPPKSTPPSDTPRPVQQPAAPPAPAKAASGAPRSRWGVPVEPEIRKPQVEEARLNQEAVIARPDLTSIKEMSPVRPEAAPIKEMSPVRPEAAPVKQESEPAQPEVAPVKEAETAQPAKETSVVRPGSVSVKEVEVTPPPARTGTGSLRFFWLQGVALRIAERIEGPLQAAAFWNATPGRTPEKRRLVRVQGQAFLDGTPPLNEFLNQEEKELLLRLVEDEVLGYGALEPLLADERVSEVMVVEPSLVYVERAGKILETSIRFQDEAHLMRVIQAILRPLGRSVSRAWPMADGRLPDGSRVNVVIPPAAVRGPALTIRKFSRKPLLLPDLVRLGSMSEQMAELLRACVLARLNMVVSGGTGSGKTTLLNALSACIPSDERIVTIEDAAELQLQQRHVVALEATPAEPDGTGRVTIRDLVVNALRMRPERIVVGECRSGEAMDMLQAMNTGHDGSLTTAHANSPRDCLTRLETMAMMAGLDLPVQMVRRQVAGGLQMIIHQARLRDGSRKVTHITEIQGIDGETIILQDLFRFHETGTDPATGKVLGTFEPGGFRPKCYPRFEALDLHFPADFFVPEDRRHGLGWDEPGQ